MNEHDARCPCVDDTESTVHRGVCPCGWTGNPYTGKGGVEKASDEIYDHLREQHRRRSASLPQEMEDDQP